MGSAKRQDGSSFEYNQPLIENQCGLNTLTNMKEPPCDDSDFWLSRVESGSNAHYGREKKKNYDLCIYMITTQKKPECAPAQGLNILHVYTPGSSYEGLGTGAAFPISCDDNACAGFQLAVIATSLPIGSKKTQSPERYLHDNPLTAAYYFYKRVTTFIKTVLKPNSGIISIQFRFK
ncbi:unnamed protein product [Clonostachys rosea f. rosea IK726]|uniref:Uncharacterized protein n=1 Tax=Clonostachys rosea f. rosea IK726 TaxID=1349383 RepID=A0ACA9UVG8_BIOOC|nr:unnamed protein product [Clonostachys rosea f. rosea IK726]